MSCEVIFSQAALLYVAVPLQTALVHSGLSI
jgi:hypothetical protein